MLLPVAAVNCVMRTALLTCIVLNQLIPFTELLLTFNSSTNHLPLTIDTVPLSELVVIVLVELAVILTSM